MKKRMFFWMVSAAAVLLAMSVPALEIGRASCRERVYTVV